MIDLSEFKHAWSHCFKKVGKLYEFHSLNNGVVSGRNDFYTLSIIKDGSFSIHP